MKRQKRQRIMMAVLAALMLLPIVANIFIH